MFPVKRRWTKLPPNPVINKGNAIGRKIDLYLPLHDLAARDIAGGLVPATTGTSTVGSERGLVTHFDDGDYLDFGDVHDLGSESMFFGCWYKTTQSTDFTLMAKAFYGFVIPRFFISTTAGNFQIRCHTTAGGNKVFVDTTGTRNDGKWHFITGVADNLQKEIRLYIDGVNLGSTALDNSYSSEDSGYHLFIGRYNDEIDGTNPHTTFSKYTGDMSDLIMGHHALNDAEVMSLHKDFYQILQPRTQLLPLTQAAVGGGRIMGSLADKGGLAGHGGIAGIGGGLAG